MGRPAPRPPPRRRTAAGLASAEYMSGFGLLSRPTRAFRRGYFESLPGQMMATRCARLRRACDRHGPDDGDPLRPASPRLRSPLGSEPVDVSVVKHPLVAARLTALRDERTDNAAFRAALRELTLMLVYEATRDAACETVAVRTPLAETTGCRLANPPLLVPVL